MSMDVNEHSNIIKSLEQFAETLKAKLLDSSQLEKHRFLSVYSEWACIRRKTLQELRKIASTTENMSHGSNVARLTGSSVGIVGGAMFIVGAGLTPFTAGLSAPVAVSGAVGMGLGASTNITAGLTQVISHKINKKTVEEIIKKDCEITEKLLQIFNMSRPDYIFPVLQNIKEYIIETHLLDSVYKKAAQEISNEIENCLQKCNAIKVQKIIMMLQSVSRGGKKSLFPVVAGAAFGEATSAIQCAGAVVSFARNTGPVLRAVVPKFFVGVGMGALGAIGVALNLVDMVYTSIAVHKGSVSPYASELKKCIESLREEMAIVQSLKNYLLNPSATSEPVVFDETWFD